MVVENGVAVLELESELVMVAAVVDSEHTSFHAHLRDLFEKVLCVLCCVIRPLCGTRAIKESSLSAYSLSYVCAVNCPVRKL